MLPDSEVRVNLLSLRISFEQGIRGSGIFYVRFLPEVFCLCRLFRSGEGRVPLGLFFLNFLFEFCSQGFYFLLKVFLLLWVRLLFYVKPEFLRFLFTFVFLFFENHPILKEFRSCPCFDFIRIAYFVTSINYIFFYCCVFCNIKM